MKVGIVTCEVLPEPDHDQPILDRALSEAGIERVLVPWDGKPCDLSRLDLLVLRSCWNYHLNVKTFLKWLEQAAHKTKVVNDLQTVRWNSDKRYLAHLASNGFAVVPTVWIEQNSRTSVEELVNIHKWKLFVIKPSVSCGSYLTQVFSVDSVNDASEFLKSVLEHGTAMIQPYLESVETDGERSVVCIAGHAEHVVVKKPRLHGDDESVSPAEKPTDEEVVLARKLLATIEPRPLYARIDLMRSPRREWVISELELIEPSLFFPQAPRSAGVFAATIKQLHKGV